MTTAIAAGMPAGRRGFAPAYAKPEELRQRAKRHLDSWRSLFRVDPDAASEELEKARNLAALADEASSGEGALA